MGYSTLGLISLNLIIKDGQGSDQFFLEQRLLEMLHVGKIETSRESGLGWDRTRDLEAVRMDPMITFTFMKKTRILAATQPTRQDPPLANVCKHPITSEAPGR
ncbi:hypothetical protein VNO77_23002 [Canavalia gladiata]|uniref:Uncharacterized protein n=1 Tax=Canavalia gladiata TaxID=3824 RepID=A0AAN9L6Z0_CANGL